ncbi:hypothetical protein L1889_18080 [Paenalcaligenes niemegkensis]|uniref:hypothetical protein n=1 Tax=Paenalcaligenes niemegkensis TaxID=2895469 RepID=UPI001EE8BA97|nr:hypothetical protein [Paenalcaligenes niemegkensis]MCQ9618349.1 hypothetical protein [Paenalcaligenes niemegkensis]
MSDLKQHGWKIAIVAALVTLAGTLDFDHEVQHEQIAQTYYNELNQRYERDYAALRVQDVHEQILRDRYNYD